VRLRPVPSPGTFGALEGRTRDRDETRKDALPFAFALGSSNAGMICMNTSSAGQRPERR
jgi:hypothetical protein